LIQIQKLDSQYNLKNPLHIRSVGVLVVQDGEGIAQINSKIFQIKSNRLFIANVETNFQIFGIIRAGCLLNIDRLTYHKYLMKIAQDEETELFNKILKVKDFVEEKVIKIMGLTENYPTHNLSEVGFLKDLTKLINNS
jgi:hypothetical protein